MANLPFNFSCDSMLYMLPENFDITKITGLNTPLPAGTIQLGETTTDGEEYTQNQTVTDVRAHQRNAIVDSFVTETLKSLALTMLRNEKAQRELYHGATESEDGKMVISGETIFERAFVYHTTDDRPGRKNDIRLVFNATVTTNGNITYAYGTHITYPILLTMKGNLYRFTSLDENDTTPGTDNPYPGNPGTDEPYNPGNGAGGVNTGFPMLGDVNIDTNTPGMVRATWEAPEGLTSISGYKAVLVNQQTGDMEMSMPTEPEVSFPVTVGNWQLNVSYMMHGQESQASVINFFVSE